MWEKDEHMTEDTLNIGRGILLGLILGALLWAVIIGFVYWFIIH